jgi:hypothetical protein
MPRIAAFLLLAVFVATASVAAAADRQGAVSADSPTYEWSGGPLFGAIVAGPVEDTLIDVQSAGTLTVTTTGTASDDPLADIDIYLYAADESGAPVGDPIASSAQGGSDEELSAPIAEPGAFVVEALAFTGTAASYKATATLASDAPPPVTDPLPTAKLRAPKAKVKSKKLKVINGTAADNKKVARVEVAVVRLQGASCLALTAKGAFRAARSCTPTTFLKAQGKKAWRYKLKTPLPKGRYVIYARAVDSAGQVSKVAKRALKVS